MPQIHHRLIIRHPSQPAILVLRDAGGLRLPAFASDDRHTAEVDYINSSLEVTQRLERAYLAGFAGVAPPERLREAFRLAAPLSFVDMAVRYRDQRPSVVRLHPWMRDLVPQTLRLALAQLDADD